MLTPIRTYALKSVPAVLTLGLLGSCMSSPSADEGLRQVDDFHDAVERLHVSNEVGQKKVRDCGVQLMRLIDGETQGEPTRTYTAFLRTLDLCEEQAVTLKQEIETVDEGAHPVFEKWREDLKAIVDPNLRQKSEVRLQRSYDRYRDLLSASRAALTQMELFDQRARDVALFLGNDLNKGSLAELDETADQLVEMGAELDERLTTSMVAIQTYLQGAGAASAQPGDLAEQAAEPPGDAEEPIGPTVPVGPSPSR